MKHRLRIPEPHETEHDDEGPLDPRLSTPGEGGRRDARSPSHAVSGTVPCVPIPGEQNALRDLILFDYVRSFWRNEVKHRRGLRGTSGRLFTRFDDRKLVTLDHWGGRLLRRFQYAFDSHNVAAS